MTLQQFLLILWARRKLILYVFGLTVLTTLVVSLLLPRQFSATTTVVIDVKSPDPIAGMVLPGLMAPGYMATQVDIINSQRVAQRVVKLLNMAENPQVREQWQSETGGEGDLTVWLATLLQKNLEARPSRESNVIEIRFTGIDPGFAAAVANAFAQAYIDTNIELRVEPARQYAAWFDTQMKLQRERLEKAQKTLSDYQQKTGIVATDERLDYEIQKYNELSSQLTLAQTQGADAASKQGQGETLPEVIQNPLINQLKADLARMEARLKELSGNLGVNHPQYQRAQAEAAELRSRLQSETARITSSIHTAGRVSQAKEAELQTAIETQKQKILELRRQRDEIQVLLREVESARLAYEAVGQRLTQSKLEAQSIQTNIAVLTPAAPPLEHSKPRVLLNVALSIFLGGMLALGAALALELSRRRVRAAEDLLALDLPLLAQIDSSQPRSWRFWRRLGADSAPAPAAG